MLHVGEHARGFLLLKLVLSQELEMDVSNASGEVAAELLHGGVEQRCDVRGGGDWIRADEFQLLARQRRGWRCVRALTVEQAIGLFRDGRHGRIRKVVSARGRAFDLKRVRYGFLPTERSHRTFVRLDVVDFARGDVGAAANLSRVQPSHDAV